jgi:hypothetical protein
MLGGTTTQRSHPGVVRVFGRAGRVAVGAVHATRILPRGKADMNSHHNRKRRRPGTGKGRQESPTEKRLKVAALWAAVVTAALKGAQLLFDLVDSGISLLERLLG